MLKGEGDPHFKKSIEHIGYRDTSARYLQDGGHENKDILPHFFCKDVSLLEQSSDTSQF